MGCALRSAECLREGWVGRFECDDGVDIGLGRDCWCATLALNSCSPSNDELVAAYEVDISFSCFFGAYPSIGPEFFEKLARSTPDAALCTVLQ